MDYNIQIHYLDVTLDPGAKDKLHKELRALAALYIKPLPNYQIFNLSTSLDDKIVVVIRDSKQNLVGFVSAMLIPIKGIEHDVALHTGITVIHESHRKTSVKKLLFANLILSILRSYSGGIWFTSLAEVISSLVHFGNYITNVFPSPSYEATHGTNLPTTVHLHIAKEIDKLHRPKMNISPNAVFDEKTFVFLASNDWDQGRGFIKDIDDPSLWSKDEESSRFYKTFLRDGAGDEVLQVRYLDPKAILVAMDKEGLTRGRDNLVLKAKIQQTVNQEIEPMRLYATKSLQRKS